jgi:trehalose/maltose transport system substrate-binding protein
MLPRTEGSTSPILLIQTPPQGGFSIGAKAGPVKRGSIIAPIKGFFILGRLRQVGNAVIILVQLATLALFLLALAGCSASPTPNQMQPVTIRVIGSGPTTLRELGLRAGAFTKFTQRTGIQIEYIPGPESSTDRLGLYLQTLERKSATPDVYLIDVVWPGILADDLVDLRPYLAEEIKDRLDAEVQNYTVDGRLVAMPSSIERGILYYRTDLLKKYGYTHPPQTWDELEIMATRIQAGERAAGNSDFWGFVWQGAAYEGLTCNALEWQASQGGGQIIEPDRTISVNNPAAIKALRRARHWIGTISPPSGLQYTEEDSRNAFRSGNAAFRRDWAWTENPIEMEEASPLHGKVGVALLPGSVAGHRSALGGWSLGVSKYSLHPREAAEVVRFMTSRDGRVQIWGNNALVLGFRVDPQMLESQPDLAPMKDIFTIGAVARPSTVTGKHYGEVSKAYFSAVHSILTGEKNAQKAIPELESELERITGFPKKTILKQKSATASE